MKIGDKVRFLNEIGGGVVVGFQAKNIVLVEDEDGFQVPMAITDVVVIDEDKDAVVKQGVATTNMPVPEKKVSVKVNEQPTLTDLLANERPGGDVLTVMIAFVPMSPLQQPDVRFEAYLINDCNYEMLYTLSTAEGNGWRLRKAGKIEANTKLFVDELGRSDLSEWDRVAVQVIAYKREKHYMIKPAVDVQLRIDTVKFYKLHKFGENDFFEEDALLYPVIESDIVARTLVIDTKKLKQEMAQKSRADVAPARMENSKKEKDAPVVVDLHASELLETTTGMSAADIFNYQLDTVRKTIDSYLKKKGTHIVFIHGKGEGVLRQAIIRELKYRYKQLTYQDASFREYGYGATEVRI